MSKSKTDIIITAKTTTSTERLERKVKELDTVVKALVSMLNDSRVLTLNPDFDEMYEYNKNAKIVNDYYFNTEDE